MNALWRESPATARIVLEKVQAETGWAYSTVKTVLSRLVEKGALAVNMRANTSVYTPNVTREDARQEAVDTLLERAFDGAFGSLLQHLVVREKLSVADRERLERMLQNLDEQEKASH